MAPVGINLDGRARAPANLLRRDTHAITMLGKCIMNGSNKLRSIILRPFRVITGARNMLMQAIAHMPIKRHAQKRHVRENLPRFLDVATVLSDEAE